jgi:two-component system, OmpR family, sensor histidine kinase BaeS
MAQALAASEQRRRELLADLAHELRTPLATIDGYLEGVADQVMPADQQTLKVLRAETARLRRLVDDLNAVSRAEARQLDLHPVPVQPGKLVTAAVQAAQAAYAAKDVTLSARVGPRLPKVAADPDRVGEVLANLLGNALRHTPPGGRVEVSASTAADGRVRIVVADTGEGIPPELLERIFERFYRADPARAHTPDGGGSGIGLTITRAIVQAHGGRIHAESHGPGRGARFVVTLPAARRS